MRTARTVRWIHTDHLNTPLRVLTSGETVTWLWDPNPFGENPADDDPDGNGLTFEQNVRFPGQRLDAETGKHYNGFRDCYDPETGRYCQPDPIGLAGGINTYAYVSSSPLSSADPTGEFGISGFVFGAISGGASGFISSGGKWQGAVIGGVSGGAVGLFLPTASTAVGTFATSFITSLAAQATTNYFVNCRDISDFDYSLATLSGLGSGSAFLVTKALSSPARNALSYMLTRASGPGNPSALKATQSVIKGAGSGLSQLSYKSAFYLPGYPYSACAPEPKSCKPD